MKISNLGKGEFEVPGRRGGGDRVSIENPRRGGGSQERRGGVLRGWEAVCREFGVSVPKCPPRSPLSGALVCKASWKSLDMGGEEEGETGGRGAGRCCKSLHDREPAFTSLALEGLPSPAQFI